MTDAFMIRRRAALALAAGAIGLTLVSARSAFALDLDQARSQGLVGERFDGYVGIVQQAPGVSQLVDSVNAQRRRVYRDTASSTGQSLDVVERLAGERQIRRANPGWYVDTGSGWQRK